MKVALFGSQHMTIPFVRTPSTDAGSPHAQERSRRSGANVRRKFEIVERLRLGIDREVIDPTADSRLLPQLEEDEPAVFGHYEIDEP